MVFINMRKKLISESGLRDINNLAKRYPKAKIYFHQDLDGVTTALAMKHYLENNGIKVVDAEIIQYGDKEFAGEFKINGPMNTVTEGSSLPSGQLGLDQIMGLIGGK